MRVPGIVYLQGKNAYTDVDTLKFGIAIHCTANTASAMAEARYAQKRTDGVSAHFYADSFEVIQSLDTTSKAGHAGSTQGNENAIAVEITGLASWSRTQWLATVAWPALGATLATVINWHWPDGSFGVRHTGPAEMTANPKVKALYGHNDMRLAWGHTTHTDPGPNFPWDRLITAINDALGGNDMAGDEATSFNGDAHGWASTQLHTRYKVIGGTQPPAGAQLVDVDNALAVAILSLVHSMGETLEKLDAIITKLDSLGAISGVAEHTHVPGGVDVIGPDGDGGGE